MLDSEKPSFDRRLTALAFADVAGYSRLMASDELETVTRWEQLRTEVLEPLLREARGTVVEIAGDALLIEFASVIDAISWALNAQRVTNCFWPSDDPLRLSLRIAINVDDVIVDGTILQGDGVNIAARIHQAAEPGQVVVTGLVRDLVGNRAPAVFKNLGTPKLKNIDRVIQVFAVESSPERSGISALHHPYLVWSSRPTVAVMPFLSIGEVEPSDYFSQGITEDIIGGLARSRSLHVIARASMLRYAGRDRDMRDIARELGVVYLLDGSVRRHGGRLRITAELVHVEQNRSIWSEHFDGATVDIFEFQDRIASQLVGALEPRVRAAEVERVRNRPTSSLDAYDCVLKAASQMFLFTEESFRLAGEALERAIELDPMYAQAYAYSTWRLLFLIGEEWSLDPERDKALASAMSQRATALDPEDAFALAIAGHLVSFVEHRPSDALPMFDTALALNENSALAWAYSGITLSYSNRPDEAMERFNNAFKLSPFDRLNFSWWGGAGIAQFVAGRYSESEAWLRRSRLANPRFAATLRLLAATLALQDKDREARSVASELVALNPEFNVKRFIEWYPLQSTDSLARLEQGLLAAGLPP
jgi:adenylate cyclase